MEIHFAQISRSLWKIYEGFITLGRLYALKSLGNKQISDKLIATAQCQRSIDAATRIALFMQRSYAKREPLIYWPSNLLPSVNGIFIDMNIINMSLLEEVIRDLSSTLSMAVHRLHNTIYSTVALQPITVLLSEVAAWLVFEKKIAIDLAEFLGEKNATHHGTTKALCGPMHVSLDNAFTPSYSILKQNVPRYGNTVREAAPYYWALAARECLAADMCSLSLIEYDGLPVDFYTDMAKQAYDEIRHAAIFLEITKTLLPEFKTTLSPEEELYTIVTRFEKYGSGLPIPLERNLYEAMWNTTLEERFILMHYDTESPGIKQHRQNLESSYSRKYPSIANQIEIVMREEITHARMGDRWLKYLLPNPVDRANAIKHARLLRGILILTSSAHYCNEPLPDIIGNMIKNNLDQCINS